MIDVQIHCAGGSCSELDSDCRLRDRYSLACSLPSGTRMTGIGRDGEAEREKGTGGGEKRQQAGNGEMGSGSKWALKRCAPMRFRVSE